MVNLILNGPNLSFVIKIPIPIIIKIPKSLFTEDGVPLACKDKFTVMNILENLENSEVQLPGDAPYNSAIIIDGMAVVNEIVKDKSMKTCKVSVVSNISNHEKYLSLFLHILSF